MTIQELKSKLDTQEGVSFLLPDGTSVPSHFHITEVGKVTKDFIDCGGTVRQTSVANLQLWKSVDIDHRLSAEKLLGIINLSQSKLKIADHLNIEVEYQGETIGKYGLADANDTLQLTTLHTDCLAPSSCGTPDLQIVDTIAEAASQCCAPGGGCC